MIIGNEKAYPVAASYSDDNPQVIVPVDGLTIRQHFAAMAMQGLISGAETMIDPKELGKQSVAVADALIAELNKTA